MDDIVVIILTLIVALFGILNKKRKKNATPGESAPGVGSGPDFWEMLMDDNKDVQNIDLMILADFCRNCLAKWYVAAAKERGEILDYEAAREIVYGMPYSQYKSLYQSKATAEQLAAFDARQAQKSGCN